jgi:photosystem II stability/assembly factor-like uncharacterized protein
MDDRLSVKGLTTTAAALLAMAGVCGAAPEPNTWHELAALPLTWIQDLSFVSARVGFAAGGNGQVLRTIDGGVTWEPVINEPQPYYWYGVHALTPNDIVASGFYNSINAYAAMIRWSHDGGDTWSDDLVLSTNPVQPNRVHFWNSQLGFVATSSGDRTCSHDVRRNGADRLGCNTVPDLVRAAVQRPAGGHVRMGPIAKASTMRRPGAATLRRQCRLRHLLRRR